MFDKDFQEWFEANKKWLYSSDTLQAAYHAWCAGVRQQQAVEQARALDLLPCGHHKDALVDNGNRQWRVACESASR